MASWGVWGGGAGDTRVQPRAANRVSGLGAREREMQGQREGRWRERGRKRDRKRRGERGEKEGEID